MATTDIVKEAAVATTSFVRHPIKTVTARKTASKPAKTAPKGAPPKPYNIRSADAAARARRQRTLRAKRKQIEYRTRRNQLTVKRSIGDVETRVQRYLDMNKRDRNLYHPMDAEHRFWDLYDRGVSE